MKDFSFVVMVLMATVALLLLAPFLLLWSVNTLFGSVIPYDARHLVAAWVLLFVIRLATRTEVKKD
jgi:hypothetical protein